MAPPVNAGFQARIDQGTAGLAGLAALFNPRRRSLAFDTAAGLNESGYTSGLMPEETNEGGNVVYRLTRGADGRLYQQAYRSAATTHNARGTFYSSFHERDQSDKRRELDAARNAIMRQFGSGQADLTSQQGAEDQRLRGEVATTRADYTDWQAAQPVPTPPAPATPAGPATPTSAIPMPTAPGQPPKNAMTYSDFLRGRGSTSALAKTWDRLYNGSRRFG